MNTVMKNNSFIKFVPERYIINDILKQHNENYHIQKLTDKESKFFQEINHHTSLLKSIDKLVTESIRRGLNYCGSLIKETDFLIKELESMRKDPNHSAL